MARNQARSDGSGSSDDTPAAKKAPAKKAAAKKAPAKKAAPRKGTARKPPPSKTAPKAATKPATDEDAGTEELEGSTRAGSSAPKAAQVAAQASAQLLALAGKGAEGVVGIDRTDDGWVVKVEVLELRRIPSTTDVLATYEVKTDESGDLMGYRRLGRYVRGTPGED